MSENYHNYQLLLAKAAQLYEKHEVGRPEPFNVFSVLFKDEKKNYEEELHTPFLHALLNYKKPEEDDRKNLKDFLQHVRVKDFELGDVKVEQERYFNWRNEEDEWKGNEIDILITNSKQAVIIENKPGGQDGDKQLWRYYKTLEDRGYSDIHLLYLTLDGRDPSDNSVGALGRKLIKCISYKDIIPWLERCQKRACDEPGLRESVMQYLQLVRKRTGIDSRRKYMKELKELCLEDNNFVLFPDLDDAMRKVGTELLWNEIGSELKSEIPDLPDKNEKRSSKGLYYQLSKATSLEVAVGAEGVAHCLWFGVGCSKKYKDKYDMLENTLKEVNDGVTSDQEPYPRWWRVGNSYSDLLKLENLELLSNDTERRKYAKETVQEIIKKGLKEVWEILEDIAMVNAIKEGEKTEFVSEEQIFEILEGIS